MSRESTANLSRLFKLTDAEAVTLRRVAFGESELRSLRQDDIERLMYLRLIAIGGPGMILTASGREHFESLPRGIFAATPTWR